MEGNTRRIALFALSAAAPIAIGICFFGFSKTAQAQSAQHLIINELQTAGATSSEEFVELFNPTAAPVALEGFRLVKKTKSGTETTLLSSATTTKFSGTIPANGYFLISHPDFRESLSADLSYSASLGIANDNTVILLDPSGSVTDKVGFGAVIDFENSPAPNPASGQSLERLNFSDTDNNLADFSINEFPSPENSTIIEPPMDDGIDGETDDNGTGDEIPEDNPDNDEDTSETCTTSSPDIRLSEVFPFPGNGVEFVEIANVGENCVDVSGWKVMDGAGHQKIISENSKIEAGEYLIVEGNLYLNNDSDSVFLLDSASKSKEEAVDQISYEKARKNLSWSFDGNDWLWTSVSTPDDENVFDSEEDSSGNNDYSFSDKVYLSELFPNPKDTSASEYIELKNEDSKSVDLFGWTIRDASKNGKYVFKEHRNLKPGKYLAIYKFQSKIALNNSNESVYLYDPNNEPVSSASFGKAPKGASYNFDPEDASWKWSKYLTPGKENKFDSPPKIKLKKVRTAYKDLFAEFAASAEDKETKKLKFSWDFGDGSKSYLSETRHKYLETGKYRVTLTVRDDSQSVEKSFSVRVRKYPQPDLEIVKIIPNPEGADTNGELIYVRNSSKKNIDLTGWKIATGSSADKTYNHPIITEFKIGPGEINAITRETSKFTLNNKMGIVQIVSPDGNIADELEYEKDKIAEGEAYVKTNGGWQWLLPADNNVETDLASAQNEHAQEISQPNDNGEVLGATDVNMLAFQSGFSSEDAYIFLSRINFLQNPKEPNYTPMFNFSSNFAYLLASLI